MSRFWVIVYDKMFIYRPIVSVCVSGGWCSLTPLNAILQIESAFVQNWMFYDQDLYCMNMFAWILYFHLSILRFVILVPSSVVKHTNDSLLFFTEHVFVNLTIRDEKWKFYIEEINHHRTINTEWKQIFDERFTFYTNSTELLLMTTQSLDKELLYNMTVCIY